MIMKSTIALIAVLLVSMSSTGQEINSPNSDLTMSFELLTDGTPTYTLHYKKRKLLQKAN